MRMHFFALPALVFLTLWSGSTVLWAQQVPATIYQVDTAASILAWTAYKVTGRHNGVVNIKSGQLELSKGELTGGTFEINMRTIQVLDLKEGRAAKLEGHLRSSDFFWVDSFPTARLVLTKVISRGTPGSYKVLGDLTIKGITKPVKFDATVQAQPDRLTASGALQIDRSEYDVRYGSGSFFENLGDRTIYDDFDLAVKLVAVKK